MLRCYQTPIFFAKNIEERFKLFLGLPWLAWGLPNYLYSTVVFYFCHQFFSALCKKAYRAHFDEDSKITKNFWH